MTCEDCRMFFRPVLFCFPLLLLGQNQTLKVTLLGTAGPSMAFDRAEAGTLVQAGGETLLFDCGRGVPERLNQIGAGAVSKVFLTHLHSDHTQGLPILWMGQWNGRGSNPFSVWGPGTGPDQPAGVAELGSMLSAAYATNTHIRRDLVEKWNAAAIVFDSHVVSEGVVYQSNGVTVTAFLVAHDPVAPAFGYRIDYLGHSVAISGDTRPSDNLVKFSQGVEVLVHEVFNAAVGSTSATASYHSVPEQAAVIFSRVAPKLAVYSHLAPAAFDPTVRTRAAGYAGALLVGSDLTTISIGDKVSVASCDASVTPAITAVTNASYGTAGSAGGALVVWGAGFSAGGGNELQFRKGTSTAATQGPAITVGESSGGYFWDSSATQMNAALPANIGAGSWTVTARNACGVASSAFDIAVQ